jgi:hypothetical protein
MLKKMTLLAMAVGALAALALPAAASAEWKKHAVPIANDVTLNFTGNARFQGGLGGVECQLTPSLLFEAAGLKTTGKVEQFTAHPTDETTNCKGLGGLSSCQIHNLTPQMNNGWVFHTVTVAGQPKIKVTNGDITSQATGGIFCLVKHITLTAPVEPNHFVTLLPNQPNTFTSGQIHGQLEADIQTNGGGVDKETVTVSGTFELENTALESHTYSI